jgi:hypothetical protein
MPPIDDNVPPEVLGPLINSMKAYRDGVIDCQKMMNAPVEALIDRCNVNIAELEQRLHNALGRNTQ